ncbi:uncharacterized protein VTP21DRAFT_1852 [Calcarisporiella thermophila]|uniref:uncharacterized protein n=1 Tax=Calcarisporiella thermophila TaxID=911321 RepID=UPI003742FDE6
MKDTYLLAEKDVGPQESSLARDLIKGTVKEHQKAGKMPFMLRFSQGTLSREVYARFILSFYHIYKALEEKMEEKASDESIKAIHFPKELSRLESIEKDLEFYLGPDWREEAKTLSPAVEAYINDINKAAERHPALLAAHTFTRYLGDLWGGQKLAKKLAKALDLPREGDFAYVGRHFYYFENISNLPKFRSMYTESYNQMKVDPELRREIVYEAINAFNLNMALFAELEELELEQKRLTEKELGSLDVQEKASTETTDGGFTLNHLALPLAATLILTVIVGVRTIIKTK